MTPMITNTPHPRTFVDRFDWAHHLPTSGLPSRCKLVGLLLATLMIADGSDCIAVPHPNLQAFTSLTRNTVRTAVRELEATGWLVAARRGNDPTLYSPALPYFEGFDAES